MDNTPVCQELSVVLARRTPVTVHARWTGTSSTPVIECPTALVLAPALHVAIEAHSRPEEIPLVQ